MCYFCNLGYKKGDLMFGRFFNLYFYLLFVLTVTLTAVSGCAASNSGRQAQAMPEPERRLEYWYVVKIAGSPVGFASDSERTVQGGVLYRTHLDMTLSRMGTKLSMFVAAEELDDHAGLPRSFSSVMRTPVTSMKISGVLRNDTLSLRTESSGYAEEQRIPWEAGALGRAAADKFAEKKLRAGETDFSFRTFDPNEAEFKTVRIKRIDTLPEVINGREQLPIAAEQYEDDNPNPVLTAWFDEHFEPLRTVISQMGMEIVLERVTPQQMESIELEPSFDIIKQSMIPCPGYPDDPTTVEDVTLRLEFEQPLAPDRDFSGPNQEELARGEDWIELTLTRATVTRTTLSPDQQAAFLEPDRYIQSGHPAIRAIADSLIETTRTTGWELAQVLAAWVRGYISDKNFEMGFASALEVLDSRAGDCTEHSLLLTALLRAAGIPARPAIGLAYARGNFVGHMWTEAYVGYWRSLDALDPGTAPIRIRISAGEEGKAVSEKDMARAYDVVGGMKVGVTGYRTTGQR